MKKFSLNNNVFEAVENRDDNFSEMKRFCKDAIKITYETCAIDDYWLVSLYCDIAGKWITVPTHNYIVKFPNGTFIAVDRFDAEQWFNEISEDCENVSDSKENLIKRFEALYFDYSNDKQFGGISFLEYALKNWDNIDLDRFKTILK